MLGNKSFSASAYEVINAAHNNCKHFKRALTSADILAGIACESVNAASRVIRNNSLSPGSINSTYNDLVADGIVENFSLNSLCNSANTIAENSDDNVISAEHMLLAILNLNCLARLCIEKHNLNIVDIESQVADLMGRPGFIFSYLLGEEFWKTHFLRWKKTHPCICVQKWIYSQPQKNEYTFGCYTADGECGLVIKENKGGEFIFNAKSEPNAKTLTVTGSRRHVSIIQACFVCFALGRLSFNKVSS